jgi:hypothetical protein
MVERKKMTFEMCDPAKISLQVSSKFTMEMRYSFYVNVCFVNYVLEVYYYVNLAAGVDCPL